MDDPYKGATGCARDRDLYKLVSFGKFEIEILFVLFIKHAILLWGIMPQLWFCARALIFFSY